MTLSTSDRPARLRVGVVGAGRVGSVLGAVAPEVLPSYVAMARLTADRALASGRLDPERAGALLAVLGSVPRP